MYVIKTLHYVTVAESGQTQWTADPQVVGSNPTRDFKHLGYVAQRA